MELAGQNKQSKLKMSSNIFLEDKFNKFKKDEPSFLNKENYENYVKTQKNYILQDESFTKC